MAKFLAVVHVYLDSADYVAAIGESDDIKLHVERQLLDSDVDESFEVVEVIEAGEMPLPSERILRLRQARNILLNIRTQDSYEIARAVDEQAHVIAMRTDPEMVKGSYDYGNIMRVVKEVVEGKNPIDH